MKFYKLIADMDRPNDIIGHYEDDFGIELNVFQIGKKYESWDNRFEFYYDENEGDFPTDYIVNDKGWFVVSGKLKRLMETMNTEIQFLPVRIVGKSKKTELEEYYIANILRVVDALCLEKSDYFETDIPNRGKFYTVSKYAVYSSKTDNSDIFKLANYQEIPIFVSEKFKNIVEKENITGLYLMEIRSV